MLKAIIVEDCNESLILIRQIINDYIPRIGIEGCASNIVEAKELIEGIKPDVVFLDIDLQGRTSFELLNSLENIQFDIIFTTAHSNYSLEAFQYNAVHYIVKPIKPRELIAAVDRIQQRIEHNFPSKQELLALLQQDNQYTHKKLSINTNEGLKLIDTDSILYIRAEGSYSCIITGDEKYMVSKPLKSFQSQLCEKIFFRINKSFLININHINIIKRSEGGVVIMNDGLEISISRNRKDKFYEKVSDISL